MKAPESNLSAQSFDHLRYTICTNRKATVVPPTSAAIQAHLLQAYYFTNIFLKILHTTKSTLQLPNFCLCEIPKKYILRCTCKTSYGNSVLLKEQTYMGRILKTSQLKICLISYMYIKKVGLSGI